METTQINQEEVKEEELPPENLPDDEFVELQKYIPSVIIDLKYATADNFTGEVIYT